MHKICFTVNLFHASTCFEHHVLIIRRSKLYYTASGIITPIGAVRCTGWERTIMSVLYCLCGERNVTATKFCFIFNICYLQKAHATKIAQWSVSSNIRIISPRSLISLSCLFRTGCVHAFSATDTLCHRLLHRWNARPAVPGDFGRQATGHCGGAGAFVSIWCYGLWKDAFNSKWILVRYVKNLAAISSYNSFPATARSRSRKAEQIIRCKTLG